MKFMMLMIPAVYQGGTPPPGFKPDPKQVEEMGRFNEELGKAFKIESLNGLHPLAKGARGAALRKKATPLRYDRFLGPKTSRNRRQTEAV
jgi:hypothetical protein